MNILGIDDPAINRLTKWIYVTQKGLKEEEEEKKNLRENSLA